MPPTTPRPPSPDNSTGTLKLRHKRKGITQVATAKKRGKTTLTARQQRSIDLAKQYQKEAAILKRKGVLTAKVNARKKITRATRTKINKFRDVLEGRAIAVRAPREVREKYSAADILPVRGPFIMAPKEYENQRARLKRGLVQLRRPLKNGTEEYVILPFKAANLPDLARRLQSDESLDGLKEPTEFFSFRLYGNTSNDSYVDAAEMGRALEFYIARLGGNANVVKHITFQRFKTKGLTPGSEGSEFMRNPHPSKEPVIPYNSNVDKFGRSKFVYGTYERQRDERRRIYKQKLRARETDEERAKRLEKQRVRQAQYRQRKFYDE